MQEASEIELDHAQLEIERVLLGMAFSYTAPTVDTSFAELLASLADVGPDHPQLEVRSESHDILLSNGENVMAT